MLLNKRPSLAYILNKIKIEFCYTLAIAIIVSIATRVFDGKFPQMPIAIPAFLGTAMSVLLSFKLNQSYDRWWEARKIWGSIVNESRTFVLQLQSFVAKGSEQAIQQIAFRQIAWCFSLGQTLRGLDAMDNLEKYLSVEDRKVIQNQGNKPLAILQLNALHITQLRDEQKLDLFSHIQINNTLINFSNAMGMAERIKNTIFPITYRIFLHLLIYLFVITLSIALDNIHPLYEIPLLLIISSGFFLLEKSATHMQDPFSNKPTDTAMTTIATNIEINIKQLLGETDLPKPFPPQKFYAL